MPAIIIAAKKKDKNASSNGKDGKDGKKPGLSVGVMFPPPLKGAPGYGRPGSDDTGDDDAGDDADAAPMPPMKKRVMPGAAKVNAGSKSNAGMEDAGKVPIQECLFFPADIGGEDGLGLSPDATCGECANLNDDATCKRVAGPPGTFQAGDRCLRFWDNKATEASEGEEEEPGEAEEGGEGGEGEEGGMAV